jgi:hypothetical protein
MRDPSPSSIYVVLAVRRGRSWLSDEQEQPRHGRKRLEVVVRLASHSHSRPHSPVVRPSFYCSPACALRASDPIVTRRETRGEIAYARARARGGWGRRRVPCRLRPREGRRLPGKSIWSSGYLEPIFKFFKVVLVPGIVHRKEHIQGSNRKGVKQEIWSK